MEEITLQDRLELLLKAYSHHYDIERDVTIADITYPATAHYFLRDENYLISKKHVLNAVENHEYVYFFLTDHLDAATFKLHAELTLQDGLKHIVPNKLHMSSLVTLVVLANTIDAEAKVLVKKTRFRKNYRLALHGWMEYRTAALESSTMCFISNPAGKETLKTMELNFNSKEKNRKGELL